MVTPADLPPSLAAYRSRIMINVLNAVVSAGGAGDSDECMVELRAAVQGMCDAIAMLVAATGQDRTAKDRRETADLCRRHVLTAGNGIAAKLLAGEELPWTLSPARESN